MGGRPRGSSGCKYSKMGFFLRLAQPPHSLGRSRPESTTQSLAGADLRGNR